MEITFYFQDNFFLLWDGDGVRSLRFLYRIVGQPIGSLSSFPLQSRQLSLPVAYTSEQCRYLCDQAVATVYQIETIHETNIQRTIPETLNLAISANSCQRNRYVFPLLDDNPHLRCRYLTFCCLITAGLYVSSGHRFGGDWMVYHEDPATCHALIVVSCLPPTKSGTDINMIQATAVDRVAESCRKRLIFASLVNDELTFLPFGWSAADGRAEMSVTDDWHENEEEFRLLKDVYSRMVKSTSCISKIIQKNASNS